MTTPGVSTKNEETPLDQKRADMAEKALDATIKVIRDKAEYYRQLAHGQRRKYAVAKCLAVALGVLTPTFVAFQTQQSFTAEQWTAKLIFGLAAIALTAGAGIVTGLQAAFKWGEGFGRSTTANLQLDELAGSIDLQSLLYRTTPDHDIKHKELSRLHETAWRQMQQIVRGHTQSEIAEAAETKEQRNTEKNVAK
jgi:hypothetical protein